MTVPSRPYKSFSYDPAMTLNVDGKERAVSPPGFDIDFARILFGGGVCRRTWSFSRSFPFPLAGGSFKLTADFVLCTADGAREPFTRGTGYLVDGFSTRIFFLGGSFLPNLPMIYGQETLTFEVINFVVCESLFSLESENRHILDSHFNEATCSPSSTNYRGSTSP